MILVVFVNCYSIEYKNGYVESFLFESEYLSKLKIEKEREEKERIEQENNRKIEEKKRKFDNYLAYLEYLSDSYYYNHPTPYYNICFGWIKGNYSYYAIDCSIKPEKLQYSYIGNNKYNPIPERYVQGRDLRYKNNYKKFGK